MEFRIRNADKKQTTEFALEYFTNGQPGLIAYDSTGTKFYIASITKDGKLKLNFGLKGSNLGLQTDIKGRIITVPGGN